MKLTVTLAKKVLKTVDAGLCKGMGTPVPGMMCVEAAVCYALGLPHDDDPKCVNGVLRSFKIALNDCIWSSNEARAKGLRKLAVAQLGSQDLDSGLFRNKIAVATVRNILPIYFDALIQYAAIETEPNISKYIPDLEKLRDICANYSPSPDGIPICSIEQSLRFIRNRIGHCKFNDLAYEVKQTLVQADRGFISPDHCVSVAGRGGQIMEYIHPENWINKQDEMLSMLADIAVDVLREMNAPGIKLLDKIIKPKKSKSN